MTVLMGWFNGLPWGPNPGAGGGLQIKSKVRLPADNETITINIEGKDEHVPRRMRIAKKDLEKFGLTRGCAACRAANCGSTPVGRAKECRKRIMEDLEMAGDKRVERETERFYEYLEEEENKRKQAKTEETAGGSNQAAASSSGGGGAEAQVAEVCLGDREQGGGG